MKDRWQRLSDEIEQLTQQIQQLKHGQPTEPEEKEPAESEEQEHIEEPTEQQPSSQQTEQEEQDENHFWSDVEQVESSYPGFTVEEQGEEEQKRAEPEQAEQQEPPAEQTESEQPPRLKKFRLELDKALEAVQNDEFKRAQDLYQHLVLDYRSLRAKNQVQQKDIQKMQDLYRQADKAKLQDK